MDESKNEVKKRVEAAVEKRVEKMVEEKVTSWITILITVAVSFVVSVVVLKFVWAWVVPDLFPGAVTQGLIIEDLTWLDTVKLAILVGMLGGIYPTMAQAGKRQK